MDRERGLVDVVAALDDLALRVHQQQVADGDELERHPERVDPEAVGELRVARGDMARDALLEAEAPEEPQRRHQALLAVAPLGLNALVRRRHGEVQLVGGYGGGLGHRGSPPGTYGSWCAMRKLPSGTAGNQGRDRPGRR